tara:strand:+ start:1150 stop:1434 length:285 start_codon:yes stop_codon:yes gene_type:complete
MQNTVHIPETSKEIKQAIARRQTIRAEWQTKVAKTRCKVRRHSRQLQVDATRQQIAELHNALAVAIEAEKHAEAVAFVARLDPVRKDFLNGLFD